VKKCQGLKSGGCVVIVVVVGVVVSVLVIIVAATAAVVHVVKVILIIGGAWGGIEIPRLQCKETTMWLQSVRNNKLSMRFQDKNLHTTSFDNVEIVGTEWGQMSVER